MKNGLSVLVICRLWHSDEIDKQVLHADQLRLLPIDPEASVRCIPNIKARIANKALAIS
jgi:hypothetical protein